MKMSLMASLVLVIGLAAAAAEPRDATEMMTEGKLQADLGDNRLAAECFETVAASADASDAQRWEALVRLGIVRRAAGNHKGSVEAFEEVWRNRRNDPEALRFLVEAVDGVVPGRGRWEEIWSKVTLTPDASDPARPALRVHWPGVPPSDHRPRYSGKPISLDLKKGNLLDIFRLFADVTGLNVVVYPGVRGEATYKAAGVPWDEALERVLTVNGLGYRLEGKVLRIAKVEQLGESKIYSGKPTDVWFRGETLAEVFGHFARLSGLKVIVDPLIAGRVNIKLDDVPWDQALDIIVRVNGLRWTREGSVIRILPPVRS